LEDAVYANECADPALDVGRRGDEVVSRWGGLMAGCFVTIAMFVLLGEIGAAIGASAFEPGDRAAAYAWGAGIWGLLSAVIAFFVGGAAAACVTRIRGREPGYLHGALVWAVAVPVIGFLGAILALGALTAGSVTAAAAATVDANTPGRPAVTSDEAARARTEATRPENIERATKTAGAMGWWMVGGLLLSLGAAALGGRVGARYGAADRRVVVRTDPDRTSEARLAG
jgi:hypothetical protein